jgi:chromosome segregation ATPase
MISRGYAAGVHCCPSYSQSVRYLEIGGLAMSQKKRAARRQVHYCRVCDHHIPPILRTDRRTCSDVCRKWAQRHPGHKRVYRGRGTVPLPPRPGQGQPKTLAEALRLLAETRAYAAKLEASAEALALELTRQQNAQAELRAELIRERERTAQGSDAATAAQERAQVAEQKVAELEKQLAEAEKEAKAEPKKPHESTPSQRKTPHSDRAHRQDDRHPRTLTGDDRDRRWTSRRDEVRRESYGPRLLLGSVLGSRRRWRDDESSAPQMERGPVRSDVNTAAGDAMIEDLRRQVTSLTNELERARRLRGEERRELQDELEGKNTALRTLNQELQNKETARQELNGRLSSLMDSYAKDRQTLDARVSELDSECAELRKQNEHANSVAADRERERDTLDRQLSTLREEHKSLSEKQTELTKEAAQWQSKAELAANAEREAKKKLADDQATLVRLRQSLTEEKEQVAALVNEKKEREAKHQELRKVSEELAREILTSFDKKQQAAEQRFAAQENERAALQRSVGELQTQIETLKAEISTLKTRLAAEAQTVTEQRNQLAGVAKERQEWAAENKEREAKQQELRKKSEELAKEFLNATEKLQREYQQRTQELKNQREELQRVVADLRAKVETQQAELSALQTQLVAHGQTVDGYKKELAAIAEERKQWAAEKAELERSRDEHKGHVADARRLAQMRERDHEQALSRTQERVSQEAKEMVGSAERTLEIERERRQSVEAMNEELREAMRRIELAALGSDGTPAWTAAQQEQALLHELKSLRQQRDGVSNERDLLSRRLLRLMEPGQYLAHATTANYDAVTDPLIALKRRELRVENDWAAIQEARNMRRRARKLDPEQTVDEQAYASALASRWRLIDRPHSRLPTPPVWRIIGFLLDEASEKYLLAIGEERIDTITQKLKQEQPQTDYDFA